MVHRVESLPIDLVHCFKDLKLVILFETVEFGVQGDLGELVVLTRGPAGRVSVGRRGLRRGSW